MKLKSYDCMVSHDFVGQKKHTYIQIYEPKLLCKKVVET